MESEKVKEIKNWLENESEVYRNEIAYNTLNLINELESENETIKFNMQETEKASFNINQMNGNLVIENQQLKDLIVELKKERAELKCSLSKKTMEYELLKCGKKIGNGIVEVINEAKKSEIKYEVLKQFAERLKDRLRYTSPTSDVLKLSNLEFDGIEVEQCIDEILKEFKK